MSVNAERRYDHARTATELNQALVVGSPNPLDVSQKRLLEVTFLSFARKSVENTSIMIFMLLLIYECNSNSVLMRIVIESSIPHRDRPQTTLQWDSKRCGRQKKRDPLKSQDHYLPFKSRRKR